jgi:hypothetical protein
MSNFRRLSLAVATSMVFSLVGVGVAQKRTSKPRKRGTTVDIPTELNFPVGPKISEDVLPKGDTFVIQTENGNVSVRNFFKGREKEVTSTGLELLPHEVGSSYVLSDYAIYFDWSWKYFAISIQKQPIQKIREQAEQALLEQLNISREDACKLDVRLNILRGVGKFDGGQDYGLSFCPTGISFQISSLPDVSTARSTQRRQNLLPRGPAVYVEQGRCPFECCTYREWRAAAPTPVYASPSSSAAQIRMLKKGEYVTAVTGFVRTRAGEFVVTRNNGRYHAGDTIWVYSYRGEGFFTVWFKGKMYVEDLGLSPYGGSGGTRCQDDSAYCWGTLKTEHSSEWWIKLRLRDGRIGWTNRGGDYSNTDACG